MAESNVAECVVVPKSLFTRPDHFDVLKEIDWKFIVIDEYHEYKNQKTTAYKNAEAMTVYKRGLGGGSRPVIGLTGTPMQNEHAELYWLADLVDKDVFGQKADFANEFEMPIKAGRKKDASQSIVNRGEKKSANLQKLLKGFYLARNKETELKDTLTDKDESVVFVQMSDLQKELYQHVRGGSQPRARAERAQKRASGSGASTERAQRRSVLL
jgi:SNF2 family DNA or RNA helicase